MATEHCQNSDSTTILSPYSHDSFPSSVYIPKPPPKNKLIVFNIPGMKPNMRLRVLNVEIHAHSVLLERHSTFFRDFFVSSSSSDKPQSAPTAWSHDLIAQLDGDKSIDLVAVNAETEPPSPELISGSQYYEAAVFVDLMNAIHNEPYEVTSLQNLTTLAQLAEDYGAIPIVSSTLDVVLMKRNEQFETDLIYQSCGVMNEAIKLQNPTLYRESLLLSVGPWQNPHYRDYEYQGEDSYGSEWYNPAVSALSRSFRNKMGKTVMDAQLSVQWGIRYQNIGLFKEGMWQEMKDVVDQLTRLMLNVEDEEL